MRLEEMIGAVLAVLLVIIIVAIGGDILQQIGDQQLEDSATAEDLINGDNLTAAAGNRQTTHKYVANIINCSNGSNSAEFLEVANYTLIDPIGGYINITAEWDTSPVFCNYSYYRTSNDYNTTLEGLSGLQTFGDWVPTIAVVIAAAVVIGVIIGYFVTRGFGSY